MTRDTDVVVERGRCKRSYPTNRRTSVSLHSAPIEECPAGDRKERERQEETEAPEIWG